MRLHTVQSGEIPDDGRARRKYIVLAEIQLLLAALLLSFLMSCYIGMFRPLFVSLTFYGLEVIVYTARLKK